jgi:uncharacterized membrane protein
LVSFRKCFRKSGQKSAFSLKFKQLSQKLKFWEREKGDMSLQRIFSLFIAVIGAVGFTGSLNMALITSHNIGPGFAPLFFSLGLFVCAVFLFVLDKSKEKLDVRALLQGSAWQGVCFFLLNVVLLIFLYLLGPIIAMLGFSILACLSLKRQKLGSLIVFSVVCVAVIYFIFGVMFKLPFDKGIIFEVVEDLI